MSLNPRNQPQTVETLTTALTLNNSGIVAVAGPLRFPRQVSAEFINGAQILGGRNVAGSYSPGGPLSGNPYSVQVVLVSGSSADIQFLGLASGVAASGVQYIPTQVSGNGYSGLTLRVRWVGD